MELDTTASFSTPFQLAPEQLRRQLDPSLLPFQTTAEVPPLEDSIGQPRAIDAMQFGLTIHAFGYNLYVAGAPGSGRESTTRAYLEQIAPERPIPVDRVYVYHFAEPDQPRTLGLPAGMGGAFARAMDEFVASAQLQLARAFEGEEYEHRKEETLAEIGQQRDHLFQELRSFATKLDFTLNPSPMGIVAIPLANGQPLSDSAFATLPPEQKAEIQQRGEAVQHAVATTIRQVHELEKQATELVIALDRDVTGYTLGPLFVDLRERFKESPDVLDYLEQVREDIPHHLADFRPEEESTNAVAQLQALAQDTRLLRYRVNLFVDNSVTRGAPIVIEHNPTYYNLFGRIDYRASLGAMTTDFRQIKPGALHRANGGFLVLLIRDVLTNPFSWDALKRALMNRAIRIENLGEQYTALPTATIRPEPVPLDVKVILIGPTALYHMVYQADEDFRELFRVKADFAPDMPWDDQSIMHYAAFISRCVRDAGLLHFDRTAVAQVIEHGARHCEDQRKLSTQLLGIANIVIEANFWATKAGHDTVLAVDVDQAMAQRTYRSNLVEERVHALLRDGTIIIDTTGERIGHVNGLSVINLGDYEFGRPTRLSARIALGNGTIQSIDREVDLAGPIHSKGFLILTSYLNGQYAQEWPLMMSASLTFEQSYDEIEGDSASSAELYALLSALAGLPIKQGIAVTGSVNQHGEVQAVGGVIYKIEGFFAICKARGLTGEQGVIIPKANVPHLMLDETVVAAVRAGQFHIWAVQTIDQGIAILTGCSAGERDADGMFPAGSVHARADAQLKQYAERRRKGAESVGSSRAKAHPRRSSRGFNS